MQSKATTVEQYLAELPDDRRAALTAVRKVILDNLPQGVEERMSYGMIGYGVPHSVYPPGYHCDPKMPLPYAGLASQKGHMSLYMMSVYCGCVDGSGMTEHAKWFQDAWKKTGKKLDMGKACVRFKKLDDVPLEVLAEAIRRVKVETFIKVYETALAAPRGPRPAAKAATKAMGSAKPAGKGKAKTAVKPAMKKKATPAVQKPASKKPAAKRPQARRAR